MSEKKEYIERGALMEEIRKHIKTIGANAERLVVRFPAADVEPVVRATWMDGKCTNCGCYGYPTYDGGNERTPFCPFCGANMTERSGSGE